MFLRNIYAGKYFIMFKLCIFIDTINAFVHNIHINSHHESLSAGELIHQKIINLGVDMKKTLIALAMIAGTGSAHAGDKFKEFICPANAKEGKWVAIGMATAWNADHQYLKTEVQKWEFKTCKKSKEIVDLFAKTDEYVGEGGTNGHVPAIQWNYDGTCADFNED